MSFSIVVMLATFAVIFPAELPDKSLFASVVLATRFRALPVWIGFAIAFLIHAIIAVTAGQLVTLLPHRLVSALVTTLFLVGAGILFFKNEEKEEEAGEDEADDVGTDARSTGKIIATAFGVGFVSEWGDLTQVFAVSLTAKYHSPLSVLIGTVAALWLVSGLGVVLGQKLARNVPLALVQRIAAVILLILAVLSFVDFLHG